MEGKGGQRIAKEGKGGQRRAMEGGGRWRRADEARVIIPEPNSLYGLHCIHRDLTPQL
jgi:hypothetical protein